MKMNKSHTALVAGLLLLFNPPSAMAQTDPQDHDAHHPPETQAAPAPAAPQEAPAKDMPGGMPGMMGGQGMGQSGMMPGQMGMMPGMMPCPMMMGGMMGMMPPAIGPGPIYGMPRAGHGEATAEQVGEMLRRALDWHANPRLKLGELRPTDTGEIVAEIVTQNGSLVQRLAVDRRTGTFRQID